MKTLVTGAAGFIGSFVVESLLKQGHEVVGLDIINDYYDINLKYGRLAKAGILKEQIQLGEKVKSTLHPSYQFVQMGLEQTDEMAKLFKQEEFEGVVNLAAQAGVRYSLENPRAYVDANIVGFMNLLEGCRQTKVKHLTYASSSSVYGLNQNMPFSTHHNVDHPISLYAASKKSNELMAHTYSHLFQIPTTGLRFFTVYGPWGRPDMALFLFTKAILENKPINVFNHGKMKRDFTYIDDIVTGIVKVLASPPKGNPDWDPMNPDPSSSPAPYRIYNIGNSSPVNLMDYIGAIEKSLGKEAEKNMLPMQDGDVPATWADVEDLKSDHGYKPDTPVTEGVDRFIKWYREFYQTS